MKNKKQNKAQKPFVFMLFLLLAGIFLWPQIAYLSSISPDKIIELTNQERAKENLEPLTSNNVLTTAAQSKGLDIFKTQTFKHTIDGRKFSDWIKSAGYDYSFAGENLAIDFVTSEGVVDAWMNSDTHKKNLLNPYFKEIGVSVIQDKFNNENSVVVIQTFGSPREFTLPIASETIGQKEEVGLQTIFGQEQFLTHSQSESLINSEITNLELNIAKPDLLIVKNSNSLGQILNLNLPINIVNTITYALSIIFILLIAYFYFHSFTYISRLI